MYCMVRDGWAQGEQIKGEGLTEVEAKRGCVEDFTGIVKKAFFKSRTE